MAAQITGGVDTHPDVHVAEGGVPRVWWSRVAGL
jgi:hypothetical protein